VSVHGDGGGRGALFVLEDKLDRSTSQLDDEGAYRSSSSSHRRGSTLLSSPDSIELKVPRRHREEVRVVVSALLQSVAKSASPLRLSVRTLAPLCPLKDRSPY
jgi:hypothetical protein